jgi:transcriptional regulator with GAF, ATPase, and Fis domain
MVGAFSSNDRHHESVEFLLLHDITSVLSSSLNLKDTLSRIFELLDIKLGLKRSILTLMHPHKEFPQIEMAHGVTQQELNKSLFLRWNDITNEVLKERRTLLISDDGELVVLGQHTEEDLVRSEYICLPVVLI